MACKCTQTTSNATGGGSITSALSACTYPLWIRHLSGCTSDLDVHFGNPGANFLFNIGQANRVGASDYEVNNFGINKTDPMHTLSMSGTVDIQDYMHFDDKGYGDKTYAINNHSSVYLGMRAGSTRTSNPGNSGNVAIGAYSIGSVGVMNNAQNNVAVGFSTGPALTTGNENVFIGASSAPILNSGSKNTFLGMRTASEITTQTGNVYLGYGQGATATESNTLRIGNQLQNAAGTTRPLIQGDFATSATTLWGSARITDIPPGDAAFLTIDTEGYLHQSKFKNVPGGPMVPLKLSNTGIWTANTQDAGGGYMGDLGYRSVSISGGTNADNSATEYFGTRVGIGTNSPTVPFHVKGKFSYAYVQSVGGGASYIASVSDQSIAYVGVAAGSGVQSGSTTWRIKAFTSDIGMKNWATDTSETIGTGFSIMRASRSAAGDASTQHVVNPFSILGDTENLDGAIVIRGDDNIGLGGRNQGVGIFTPSPNTELTVVGAMSATGAIHSTDYIKFPNPAQSMYIGYSAGSGDTSDIYNTAVGYASMSALENGLNCTQNTAVGRGSLQFIGLGGVQSQGNVAIGDATLENALQSNWNTAVGSKSMENISSTSLRNTALGNNTLKATGVKDGNTAIGYGSQNALLAENYNTTVGYSTMVVTTTGNNNVAIGASAVSLPTALGLGNVYIGSSAGNHASTTGKGHVIIGSGSATGATTANDVISLGYNAQPQNMNHSMNLGDVIYAGPGVTTGVNGRKAVGINKTLPLTALDVVYEDVLSIPTNRGGGSDIVTFGDQGTGYSTGLLVQLRGASGWVPADADHTSLQGNLIGIALGDSPASGILLKGYFNVGTADDIGTYANGGPLYVSTTAGKVTETLGLHGVGDYVRIIGHMLASENRIYFNPDSTFIVL